ncbi:serine/threonine-protein kinase [Actinomadura nitritigenes]|uniref:serine/threonine-protein kinase n=1 Tax=Actinomadura nitritigenes TaxID=134602 RepID=UPI003D8AC7B6
MVCALGVIDRPAGAAEDRSGDDAARSLALTMPTFSERFQIIGRLGGGGMGVVWHAHDATLNRAVAVKQLVLPSGLDEAESRVARERAFREARAAAALRHPGIIAVHDVVRGDDGGPWIVMELIRGRSLDEEIRRSGPLPQRRVAEIGLSIMEALRAAHAQGVLHRDVKPANIMLGDDGRVILTDFGIASMAGDPSLTRTGALIGSPGFIAPERLREEAVGPESDVWSLGAALYAAVEGRAPYERDTPMASLGAVISEPVPRPRRAGELTALLVRMLEKDPVRRLPADAAEQALRRAAAGRPTRLTVPSAWPSRRRRLIAAAAASVAVAATAIAVTLVATQGPASSGRRSPTPTATATSPAAVLSAVDYCGLLTSAQANAIIPGGRPSRDGTSSDELRACTWTSKAQHRALDLGPPRNHYLKATVLEAHADFSGLRNLKAETIGGETGGCDVQWSRPSIGLKDDCAKHTEPRDVAGIGEEAFAYELTGGPAKPIEATVILRVGNVLAEVDLEMPTPATAGSAVQRALDTAHLVAQALGRKVHGG